MRGFGTLRASAPWGVLAISAMFAVFAIVLGFSGDGGLVIFISVAALGMVFGVVGALVVSRSSGNLVGWIFCALALVFEASILGEAYVGASRAGDVWVAWAIQSANNALTPALIIFCFLLFPTGRLPSPRWRPVAWVAVSIALVHTVSVALAPGILADSGLENPAGVEGATYLGTVADFSIFALVVPMMLVSALSIFARMRRSSGVERQQIKWFAFAAALLAANLLAANVLDRLLGESLESEAADLTFFLVFAAVLSGIPVAMGVAILRYRLYDIDILINRTIVYGSLSASLVAVYVFSVASLGYLFRAFAGSESQLAVVASTLAIAALFNPLRRRIQTFVDRRFYRSKYDARRVLEAFSARLRSETELETLSGDLVGVVRETVRPAHVSLWLKPSAENHEGVGS